MDYGAYFITAVAAEFQKAGEPESGVVIRVFRMQDIIQLLTFLKRDYLQEARIGFTRGDLHNDSPRTILFKSIKTCMLTIGPQRPPFLHIAKTMAGLRYAICGALCGVGMIVPNKSDGDPRNQNID